MTCLKPKKLQSPGLKGMQHGTSKVPESRVTTMITARPPSPPLAVLMSTKTLGSAIAPKITQTWAEVRKLASQNCQQICKMQSKWDNKGEIVSLSSFPSRSPVPPKITQCERQTDNYWILRRSHVCNATQTPLPRWVWAHDLPSPYQRYQPRFANHHSKPLTLLTWLSYWILTNRWWVSHILISNNLWSSMKWQSVLIFKNTCQPG